MINIPLYFYRTNGGFFLKKAIALRQLRQFSNFLDRAIRIPGTSHGIGLDPIIGLIPGVGDILGAVLAGYIVVKSAQLGVPKKKLLIMTYNVVIDSVVGTAPVFGDLFDVAWKANVKNVDILEAHLNDSAIENDSDINDSSIGYFQLLFVIIGGLILFIIILTLIIMGAIALF